MEPKELEIAIRDRLDDAREILVPIINDTQLRGLLSREEGRRLMGVLAKLVELRGGYAARVNR